MKNLDLKKTLNQYVRNIEDVIPKRDTFVFVIFIENFTMYVL